MIEWNYYNSVLYPVPIESKLSNWLIDWAEPDCLPSTEQIFKLNVKMGVKYGHQDETHFLFNSRVYSESEEQKSFCIGMILWYWDMRCTLMVMINISSFIKMIYYFIYIFTKSININFHAKITIRMKSQRSISYVHKNICGWWIFYAFV